MKKIVLFVLLLFIVLLPIFSQQEEPQQDINQLSFAKVMDEFISGEIWAEWTEGEKLAFSLGYLQATRLANIISSGYDGDGISYLRMSDVFEIIFLVDAYYNSVKGTKDFLNPIYIIFTEAFDYYMQEF